MEYHSTGSTTSKGSSISQGLKSIKSSKSSKSEGYWLVTLPRPNMQNVPQFREWLAVNFAAWMSQDFLDFLFEGIADNELDVIINFILSFNPRILFNNIGRDKYEKYRDPIIELRLIFEFVMKLFTPDYPITALPYQLYLDYRERHLERFERTTPYGIMLSEVYHPPSPPPPYQKVSPLLTKADPFITPDTMTTQDSYLPSNPTVDFTNTEVSILSSKSAGSHRSGRDPVSVTRRSDSIRHVSPTPSSSTHPQQSSVSIQTPPRQPYRPPSVQSATKTFTSLRELESKLSGRPPTPAASLFQIFTDISDSTPVNSNPRKPAGVGGGNASNTAATVPTYSAPTQRACRRSDIQS